MTTKFNESLGIIGAMLQDITDENIELLKEHPELQHHLNMMKRHGLNAQAFERKVTAPKAQESEEIGLTLSNLTTSERYILGQLKRSGGNLNAAMLGSEIQRLLDNDLVTRELNDIQITKKGLDMVKPASRQPRQLTAASVLVR